VTPTLLEGEIKRVEPESEHHCSPVLRSYPFHILTPPLRSVHEWNMPLSRELKRENRSRTGEALPHIELAYPKNKKVDAALIMLYWY
jgi:hypothetical protein